jgi:hypothetical protein
MPPCQGKARTADVLRPLSVGPLVLPCCHARAGLAEQQAVYAERLVQLRALLEGDKTLLLHVLAHIQVRGQLTMMLLLPTWGSPTGRMVLCTTVTWSAGLM